MVSGTANDLKRMINRNDMERFLPPKKQVVSWVAN